MFNFLSNLIATSIGAGHSTSFLSVGFGSMIFNVVRDLAVTIYNFFLGIIWVVLKWFLGALDAMQHIVTSFLGIDTTGPIYSPDGVLIAEGNSISVGEIVTEFKTIFSGGNSYFDMLMSIFRALTVVAIILMIIFAIVAMVMQEWRLAEQQKYSPDKNDKMKIIKNVGVNILTILLMPLTFYFVIIGTNSILTSFYRAIGNDAGVSLGGQVLASSTYDANRYRTYANANKRVPITIQVYDPTDADANKKIKTSEVQNQLKAIAGAFANNSFLSFEKSTVFGGGAQYSGSVYRYNNETFAYGEEPLTPDPTVDYYMGNVFENFICTREQYYVMADFVDYCQMHNMQYYIKAISESDIDWKYVDSAVVTADEMQPNGTAMGEVKLTVNYRDAALVTGEPAASAASGANTNYSITFTTEKQVVSAVSDALTTVSTLLGLGENPAMYNTMERDDSGDYTNLVSWANEKAILKLSPSFNINDPINWTYTDQMIIYEYFKYSSNNTLENYTLDALQTTGAEIDVQILNYKTLGSYFFAPEPIYCIKLNGSYYRVQESSGPDKKVDAYGNPYYEFIEPTTKYFRDGAIQIEKVNAKTTIKLSSGFNINNNANWTVSDCILVYEYFSNLSLSNELRRYKFTDLYNSGSGIEFNVFKIKDGLVGSNTNRYFIYINNTYYEVDSTNYKLPSTTNNFTTNSGGNFMVDSEDKSTVIYNFQLNFTNAEKYGLPVDNGGNLDKDKVYLSSVSYDSSYDIESDIFYTKYANINLKLSPTFDFTNSETWTYRDYLIFYIYSISNHNSNVEMLKLNGIQGNIIKSTAGKYYLKTNELLTTGGDSYFLDLESFEKVSDLRIQSTLEDSIYEDLRLDMSGVGVEISYDAGDRFYRAKTEVKLFEFSDDFDEFNPETWTIGDYYLCYFSNQGVINSSLNVIKNSGYSSLVYEIVDGSASYKLYRFGGNANNYHYINSATLPTYVINEDKGILGQHTIESFFETNLMNYVFSSYLTSASEDKILSYSDTDFLNKVYEKYTGYVYKLDADLSSPSSLIKKLIEERFPSKTTEIASYTYKNATFALADPSTWTDMDIAIYAITGTNSGSYTSRLIKTDDDKMYFLVENYLLDISTGSRFECTVNSLATLSSPGCKFTSDANAELTNLWNSRLAGMVVSSIDSETLLSNAEFTYETKIDLSGSATFTIDTQYTELDIIIYKLGLGVYASNASAAQYKSYVYLDSSDNAYIKLGNKYIKAYSYDFGSVVYSQGNTISLKPSTNIVADTGTKYKTTKYVASNFITSYKYLDAFVFERLGEIKEQEYKIFQIGGSNYIYVAGQFIKVAGLTSGITSASSLISGDSAINEKYIEYIYNNYYSKYKISVPSYAPATKIDVSDATNGYVIDISNIDTWTPLGILLYSNGLIENGKKFSESYLAPEGDDVVADLNTGVRAETVKSGDGTKLYLFVHRTFESGEIAHYYFNITDLVEGTTLAATKLARIELQLRLATCVYDSTDEVVEKRDVYSTIDTHASAIISSKVEYSATYKYEVNLSFSKGTPNTLNWLKLLYYYYNGSAATGVVQIERYFANNKRYLVLTKGTTTHYYEYDTALTTNFTMSSEKTANYGIDSQITSLVIENASGIDNCRYREVTTNGGIKMFYFQNDLGEYCAVYGLSADTKQSLEEYRVYSKTVTGTPPTTVKELLTNTQADAAGFTSSPSDAVFTYITKGFEELDEWNLLDFVVNYLKTSSNPQYVNTRIYNFGGTNFFKFNSRYVNIINSEVVSYTVDTTGFGPTYYGELTSGRTLIDFMSSIVFKPATNAMVSTSFGEINYDEERINPTFDLNNYIVENGTTGTDVVASKYLLEEDGSVSTEPIQVVTGKVIGYTTSIGAGATLEKTYTYRSLCETVTDRYYLSATYLDLVIFKATGTMPAKNSVHQIECYKLSSDTYLKVYGFYIKVTSALTTLITPFDDVVEEADDRLNDDTVVTSTVINFSASFDPADYSTWTITDYILYYVFTNGNYRNANGTSDFEIAFPYSYTASYDEVGSSYSNMTYLDLAIYHSTGALPNKEITYKFNVYEDEDATSDALRYYLKVADDMFVTFSEYIKLNTQAMTIESAIIPGYVDNLNTSFNEYYSDFTDALKPIQYKESMSLSNPYMTKLSASNMQYFVNIGGMYANVYTLTKPDGFGSTKLFTVVDFRNSITPERDVIYYNYDVLVELYNKKVGSNIKTTQINSVDISIVSSAEGASTKTGLGEYELKITYDEVVPDFDFENYYYYKLDFSDLEISKIMDVPNELKTNVLKGVGNITGTFNLKLDAGGSGQKTIAQLLDTTFSDWTFRDLIIMLEFSNDVRHNIFKGMDFSEVYTDDYLIDVYTYDGLNAIYINGNFYNITGFTTLNSTTGIYEVNKDKADTSAVDESKIYYEYTDDEDVEHTGYLSAADLVSAGTINDYSFRTLVETKKFSLNSNYSGYYTIVDDLETIIFSTTVSGKTITQVKQIRSEIANVSYQVNLLNFEDYTVEPFIKKVSWVQKLMTDMQVYYPDLNWSTLLATDGWLDTLGDYVSAYTTGLYVSDNNSSNVTAAGIVLAEFFMSKATRVYGSYADYEFSSMFDEKTINALFRSLMGADNFTALEREAQLFMDFFNSTYAPILDDLSAEFGEAVNGDSLRMCVYKSYLATILLSSDIGEYLYTVATRVYSEYTIGEYLAGAGNDYAGYYSYVNKLSDENGKRVDAYNYGSFAELVQYENEFCGNATPTFTFNFKKAFSKHFDLDDFKKSTHYSKLLSRGDPEAVTKFNECTTKEQVFTSTNPDCAALKYDDVYYQIVYYLVDKINVDYENIYDAGHIIGENGYESYKTGENISTNKEYIYCYMIHVYWSIDQEVTFLPFYVDLYRQYLEGDISRWEIIDDACVENCDQYISKYLTYEVKLQLYKTLSFASLLKLLMPSVALNDEDADNSGLIGLITSIIQSCKDNGAGDTFGNLTVVIPAIHGKLMLKGGKIEEDINYIYSNSLLLYFQMFASEDSSVNDFMKQAIELIAGFFGASIDLTSPKAVENAWNKIVEYDERLARVIMELEALTDIGLNEQTSNGTVKTFDTPVIEVVINAFKDVKLQIEKYISTQQLLDQIQKRSITFTLAQFGSNYVSSGFSFAVKNKEYTFKSTVDPSRLAEYVYGGAFLESVGVGAQYTEPTFEGIIETSKVYDSKDKVVKTELNCWSKLRGFASELADYTATIYFLTNLGDLSPNYENTVKMTDVNSYDGVTTTQEAVILEYFINDTDIAPETIARLIVPTEPEDVVELMGDGNDATVDNYPNAYKYIQATSDKDSTIVLDDSIYTNAAQEYLNLVRTTGYTDLTERYFSGNSHQVIHQIFENVMNYMLVTNPGGGAEIKYINYENMTFEGMKREVIQAVVENRQYTDEDSKANAARYLALFGLVSAQFEYSVNGTYTGRIIKQSQLNLVGSAYTISAEYVSSYQTEQSVLMLSGLENRPTTDIVAKQNSDEVRTEFDEADGDVFIICTYNPRTNLYVPILASNGSEHYTSTYQDYQNLHYTTIYSDYYADGVYPIIAKGIITADGYPTAIRKYENPIPIIQSTPFGNATTIYNQVVFYRTNLGANTGTGADYASMSQAVNRVTTKNYTNFTMSTSFTSGIGSGTTYTGEDNIKSSFQSDISANYIQINGEYLIVQQDDYGAISVLDDFHNFYTLGGQSLILCIMALMILFPILYDASLGVMRRLFDLLFLFIASPMMVAMKSTSEDNKSKSFDIWVRDMQGALFGCLGYIMGFSSYFILFGAIYNIDSFISMATYQSIAKIGGLGNFITYGLLNSVLRCCWVLAGVYIIKTIPKALLPIVTGNKLTSEDSPLGKGGSMSQRVKQLTSDIQKIAQKVGAVMSGKALMQLKDMAIQTAKDSVPGMKLAGKIGGALKAKKEGKEIEKALVEYGVDKDTAGKAGKSVSDKKKAAIDKKRDKQEKNAADFKKTFEMP